MGMTKVHHKTLNRTVNVSSASVEHWRKRGWVPVEELAKKAAKADQTDKEGK